jgi:hypothetical protein
MEDQTIKVSFDTTELEASLAKAAVVVATLTSRVESLEVRMQEINRQAAKAETDPSTRPKRKRHG